VTSGIQGKCTNVAAVTPAVLAQFPKCPSPADADDGANNTVDTFAELAACEITINERMVETLRNYILRPDAPAILADANGKAIAGCANTIAKSATKLWSTVSKERGKCQAAIDKGLAGTYEYTCSTYDVKSKIAGAVSKLEASIDAKCGSLTPPQLGLVGTCDTSIAGIKACVANAVKKNASGVTAVAFDMDQICPEEVRVAANAGTGSGGRLTQTVLDTGWTGLGHRVDVVDGFVARVNLSCADTDCNSCTVTTNCEAGNCRCNNNPATPCTTPFVQDVCGAGNLCIAHFGPPLALSAGGSPVCVSNTIQNEIVGTADAGTGETDTQVNNIARVFLGLSQDRPCPTCEGGTCQGGANNGSACTVNATHPDFGPTSYQCQPALASNISGSGLKVNLSLTDGSVSLPFGDACDGPFNSLDCACGVCSGDNGLTCVTDGDCAGFGGACVKGTAGSPPDRQPNKCLDLSCEQAPGHTAGYSLGQCSGVAETLKFCDGFLRQSGAGIIPCSTDADCDNTDCNDATPQNDGCGACTHEEQPNCFVDPITAEGVAGQDGGVLVSTFCSPATTNPGINGAGGVPGAGRLAVDFDFTGYCPDGVTEFELGGANCP
jgi:hypothetical protein